MVSVTVRKFTHYANRSFEILITIGDIKWPHKSIKANA